MGARSSGKIPSWIPIWKDGFALNLLTGQQNLNRSISLFTLMQIPPLAFAWFLSVFDPGWWMSCNVVNKRRFVEILWQLPSAMSAPSQPHFRKRDYFFVGSFCKLKDGVWYRRRPQWCLPPEIWRQGLSPQMPTEAGADRLDLLCSTTISFVFCVENEIVEVVYLSPEFVLIIVGVQPDHLCFQQTWRWYWSLGLGTPVFKVMGVDGQKVQSTITYLINSSL